MPKTQPNLPYKEIRRLRDKKILDMWKLDWSQDEIVDALHVSKKTVSNVIRPYEEAKRKKGGERK